MEMLDFLQTMLEVQLFWALAITLLVATIPAAYLTPVALYTNSTSADTLENLGNELEGNVQNQLNLPLIDAAALVFYSGNIVVDLLLNFFTAVPQMFTLLLEGFFILIPIDAQLQTYVKLFAFTVIAVMYFIGLIAFLTNMRSGKGVN